MKETKKTFWPYGIVLFLLFMVCAIITSVVLAMKSSPEDDNAYFSTRQEIDKNINDIIIEQKLLEDSHDFYIIYGGDILPLQKTATRKSTPIYLPIDTLSTLALKITPSNANHIRMLLTRFATSKDDVDIDEFTKHDDVFESSAFALKQGYWKALINIDIDGKNAFFEQLIIAQ